MKARAHTQDRETMRACARSIFENLMYARVREMIDEEFEQVFLFKVA
jgi:hypothetical protein